MFIVPRISVLMPVYNCELYINEAIDSILNQSFEDFELLLIDDCSTDKTLEICKSYKDSRIVIIEKDQNSGYTNSLNYGLSIAKGEYIARMDGDDISMPTRFEKQISFLDANPEIVVCGTSFQIIGSGEIRSVPELHNQIVVRLLYWNCIAHPTVIMRGQYFKSHQIRYNQAAEPAEDYNLWVRLCSTVKLYNYQESLVQYRIHNKQVSNNRRVLQIDSAANSRIELLRNLKCKISEEEIALFSKANDPRYKLNILEFKKFLLFKNKMISANKDAFFNEAAFLDYWTYLENKFISYHFKYRRSYRFSLIRDYFSVCGQMRVRLNTVEFIKILYKIFTNYKLNQLPCDVRK